MKFEFLPNEIILAVFEYFSFNHLFDGFFGLNSRFNHLLFDSFQKISLDFRLTSKTHFDRFYKNHLPKIIDQTISLHLSSDDDTPQQIQLFLHEDYQLRQFIYLKSLTITHVRRQMILDDIMTECSHLPCLTHLTFTGSHLGMDSRGSTHCLINQIWSLPKLKYCRLNIGFYSDEYYLGPSVTSTSITHVILDRAVYDSSPLHDLCQYTPNLQYLSLNYPCRSSDLHVLSPIYSMRRLKICLYDEMFNLHEFFRLMPNLNHLSVQNHFSFYISGDKWEQMIRTHLPKLQIFELKMQRDLPFSEDMESQVDGILHSFRTKFWTDEHQWFVRCDYYESNKGRQGNRAVCYTLPYPFAKIDIDGRYSCVLTKSTGPQNEKYRPFDNVIKLSYKLSNSIISLDHFRNLERLSLDLPLNETFFSSISSLNRLSSLTVSASKNENSDHIQLQLQLLLDRLENLRSLKFNSWLPGRSHALLLSIASNSIRRLDLQNCHYFNEKWQWFDEEECIQLSNSPLGKQCETLMIKVKTRQDILTLLNHMPKLQALTVRCLDDTSVSETGYRISKNDELIPWLLEQLPSTYHISRNTRYHRDVLLWIR